MAEPRRAGCGCLSTLLLLALGVGVVAALVGGLFDAEAGGGILALVLGVVIVASVIGLLGRARRSHEESDTADDGAPTSTVGIPRQIPPPDIRPSSPPSSPPRPPRGLRTNPEDPEARRLKERLAEAVADLADEVEAMPEPGRGIRDRPSSEEMIAQAKRRIAERRRREGDG